MRAAIAAPKFSGDGSFTAQCHGLLETVAWDSEDPSDDILHSRAGDGCAPPVASKKRISFFPSRLSIGSVRTFTWDNCSRHPPQRASSGSSTGENFV